MEINTESSNNTTNVEIEERSMNIMESLDETNTTETVKELSLDIENDAGDKNHISGGLNDGSIIQERSGIHDISVENASENDMDSPVKKSGASLQRFCDSDASDDELEDVRKMSELNEEPANSEVGNRTIEDSPDNTKSNYDIMKSRLKALCDSESSEDEREPLIQSDDVYAEKDLISKSKSSVKKSEKPKERKMTAKEYEEQKLEIKSESQRMQRERNISLPYHRSKPRSLKEFLEKRPRFTSALSDKGQKASPILAIKMTNQNLEKISMKLEEREKMLEIFYKSESDSEDENNEENSKIDKPKNVLNNCDNPDENIPDENITTNLYEEIIPTQIFENTKQTAGIIEILSEIIIPKNSEEKSTMNNTTDYAFSLDNVDLSENISDCINAEENTTFNESVISEPKKGLNRMQLLREALGNSAPKLSGDPNEIINLDEDVQTPNKDSSGIDNLIERFIKHSKRKNRPKDDSVQIDILTISNGELRNEKATMQLYNDSADEPVAVLETPGAKLKKLRTNLQSQMAQRRAEMWKQKNVLMENMNSNGGRGTKEGYEEGEYDLLLDDEEEDEFDVEEEEDEEELEENDVDMTEKKRDAKSAFIDEEAEISETEDVVSNDDEDHDGDDEEEEENDVETNNFDSTDEINSTKKKLKRIIVMDDSDDENNLLTLNNDAPKDKSICKGPLDSTDPWEDEDDSESQLPPNAQRPSSRQRTPQLTRSKSSTVLGLITPVRQLTALQSFESAPNEDLDQSQQTQGVTHPSPVLPLPPDPSPLKGNMWQRHLLFPECDSATNGETMVNMEELANEICSGKFSSSISYDLITNNNDKNVIKPWLETEISSQPSTQDILDTCPWNFTCTTENVNCNYEKQEFETNSHQNNFDKDQSTSKVELMQKNKLDVNKKDFEPFLTLESLSDDDDKVISQLLDEEEMEKFKKKFESPLNIDEKAEVQPKSPICCRIMFDTSDEDEIDNNAIMGKMNKLRKKRQKKCLVEDSDEDEVDNAHIGGGDDFISAVETLGNRENVDYDSEENEMVKKESRPVLRVDEFFENEAELTESEWDSADEDEKGLDELDIEVGDEEQFDEEKLRSGIERVQLRQMLDEDNKDLKILQEILLEDGELHGTGRERQFRWRNIDNTFDLESGASKENDEEQLEDCSESEEMWRKKRHERVQFLQSKNASEQEVSNDFIIASNSILKLGEKAIVRNASVLQNSEATAEEVKIKQQEISLIVKQPFALINKRGSFLSRGEKALAKVAEFTKLQKGVTTGPTKFSRKFLFSTVLNDSESDHAKKRKADDGTPTAIKKLRLDGLSPARFSSVSGKTSAKKLFKTT